MANWLDSSLSSILQSLQNKQITSVELVSLALERAQAITPKTNAYLEIHHETALLQAHHSDAYLGTGVLQGIPLAHKDCFAHQGQTMSVGTKIYTQPATSTATVIKRLHAAGSIEIGRLHLSEVVAGPSGNNVQLGDCLNAWNTNYISGGSSSGSAVAVATGSVFASLGTDTGGSIRIPAALNGLFGVKPSFGRVSRYGSFPRSFSSDSIGPLARTAKDCALIMQIIAGADQNDAETLGIAKPDYISALEQADRSLRLGVFVPADKIDDEVQVIFEQFIEMASRRFGLVPSRRFDEWRSMYALGDTLSKVEAAQVHASTMALHPEGYAKAIYTRTEPGLHLPAIRYIQAMQLRSVMLNRFIEQAFADVDVLLLPTLPMTTPLVADMDMEAGSNVYDLVPRLTGLTRPFNYLGLPVVSMPMGLDTKGMPLGVQLIGKPYSEARLLALAHRLSADMQWSFLPSTLALVSDSAYSE